MSVNGKYEAHLTALIKAYLCAFHGTVFGHRPILLWLEKEVPKQSSSETNTLNKFQLKRQLADVGRPRRYVGVHAIVSSVVRSPVGSFALLTVAVR